jgi:hypothetical protein
VNVTKTLKTILASLLISAGVLAPSGAGASVTTYSSVTAFDAAMTGLTTTSFMTNTPGNYATVGFIGGSFSGASPNGNFYIGGNGTTVGLPTPDGGYLLSSLMSNTFTINFTSPVYGFAVNGGDWANSFTTYAGTPYLTFNFAGSGATIGLPGYMVSGSTVINSPTYMGFASSTPFTSVTVNDVGMSFATEYITTASGLSSTNFLNVSSTSPVPEPGSIALLMLGGLGFIGAGRKIKNNGNTNGRSAAEGSQEASMKTIKTLKTTLSALAIAAGLFASAGAQATITTYSSATAFDAAMTGLTTTSYATAGTTGFPSGYSSLNGTAPNQYAIYGTNPIAFSGGSFSGTSMRIANNSNIFAPNLVGYVLVSISGSGTEQINFNSPVYGFAMDAGAEANWGGIVSPYLSFSFAGSSATVGFSNWFNTSPNYGAPAFVGFSSDTAFSVVNITDPSNGFATQDITIATGAAKTISAATTTVPEPASIALLMLGSLGFIGAGRSSKSTTTLTVA